MESAVSILCFDYKELLENYEKNMLDKLRNFSADNDVLDTWVPSNNLSQSILSLTESVWLSGYVTFVLNINAEKADKEDIDSLIDVCQIIADVEADESSDGFQLTIEKKNYQQSISEESIIFQTGKDDIHQTRERSTVDSLALQEFYLRAINSYSENKEQKQQVDGADSINLVASDDVSSLDIVADQQTDLILKVLVDSSDDKQRKVLEALASVLIGLPVREAVDHGTMHLLHVLTKQADGGPPVPGILSCPAAGPAFSAAQKLMIQIGDQHKKTKPDVFFGYNEFDRRPTQSWSDLSKADKIQRIEQDISRYIESMDLPDGDIQVLDVEYGVRVLIGFTGELMTPAFDKGVFLMALERSFRETMESRLEVYMQPRRDQSKLRRLT